MIALLTLSLTLTFNVPACVQTPCYVTGLLTLQPNESNRRLIVEVEGDRPSAKPGFQAFEVVLDGKESHIQMPFVFRGPAIYNVTVTLKRAAQKDVSVSRSIRVDVEEER